MKKSSFFAGFLSALILFGIGGTALAYQAQATLDYPGITVTLDGEALDLRDAQGNKVDPFTMNDTTYLPVRAISNALGLGVDWDGKTNTVILTSPENEWADYAVHDCYADFSVPSLENVVGTAALEDVYYLSTGDSVAYTYDPTKFRPEVKNNFRLAYFRILELNYGFEHLETDGDMIVYENKVSGIMVAGYPDESTGYYTVLLMRPEAVEGIDIATVRFAWRARNYVDRVHLMGDVAVEYANNGGGSAYEIKDVSTGFYDEALPMLKEDLYKEIANDDMYTIYTAAVDYTEVAEELIYRYAEYESDPTNAKYKQMSEASSNEIDAYYDFRDNVAAILGIN